MKRVCILFFLLIIFQIECFAESYVFSDNNKFGLKTQAGEIIVSAKYKKLVRLGETAWIMQQGTKFGIISDDGKIIVEPKYNQAERVLGKFVKFSKGDKYGIFDEMGFDILPVEYSSIDLLYGGMFVTCKNYKYGITDLNGLIILDNIFDDIYMPDFHKLILVYGNQTYEIERPKGEGVNGIDIPKELLSLHQSKDDISITELASSPFATTGYYGVTLTDYTLKLISSISPAYEQTIDELMYSKGADSVSILMKFSWIPKFPFVYAKRYYKSLIAPNNGPLNGVKTNLKSKIKE